MEGSGRKISEISFMQSGALPHFGIGLFFRSPQRNTRRLCFQVPIPTHGERPLEEHAEMFLREAKNILGDIPIVVVFTKYDRLLTFMRAKMKAKDPEKEAAQYLRKNCIDAIKDVSGDPNILHVEFSSRRKHERGVDKLLELTCNNVCRPGQQPSVAVQRSALVK
ncbi:hypothetical protein PISMIDRAFT_539251 [Pisolithus microcarpus 441]|uniref:Uncharacterized protein n=1 Tax=Pisolithus microcarpus 441 TaxID=765257 RepID=A0A0C9YXG8_9AGAM|nr:hypothetical protein PISMIDRAFT_539251 [Pisolithus microcarpus 441]